MNNVHGEVHRQDALRPGPFRMAPGLPGRGSPADGTGVYNGQATYTGCAVDGQHNVFASDIGTAQGSFPIPTDGRLIEWFAPSYTTPACSTGPTPAGSGRTTPTARADSPSRA